MRHNNPNVLIIGLGEIGYSDAEYMTSLGINVDGYDINPKAVARALNSKVIQMESRTFEGYDYYVICVSTHKLENLQVPCLDALFRIACKLSHEGKRGSLVSIESTITKGVSNEVKQIVKHKMHVAHVPHRYFAGEREIHGVRQIRVLGGCESCCTLEALHFYRDILDIPTHIVKPVELAELSKIVENSHRFMEIAFAEELKILCDAYNLDFNDLRAAINSKWNVKILAAEQGIGGHCLPKDTQMYLDLSAQILRPSIIDSAKAVDNQYKKTFARKPDLKIVVPAIKEVNPA